MVYDNRQDNFGEVDLNLQGAWLKHMEDVWPEAWTGVLLDLKEFLSRYPDTNKMPHLLASLHLTCAADALADPKVNEEEKRALLNIFQGYLEKKRLNGKAHLRTEG